MKKLLSMAFCLTLVLNFAGCWNDEDSGTPPFFWGGDPGGDTTVDPMAGYTSDDIAYEGDTVKGYPLPQFVDEATVNALFGDPEYSDDTPVDCRKLFNYRIVGADGWDPLVKGNPDLNWDQFMTGYLLEKVYDAKVYFPSDDIKKAYDVKNARDLNAYRKIDIIKDADESDGDPIVISFELSVFSTSSMQYWNNKKTSIKAGTGFSITELLTGYVIAAADRGDYNYKIVCADGYVTDGSSGTLTDNTCTWAELEDAYFIIDEDGEAKDKIVFLGSDYTGDPGTGSDVTHPEQAYKSVKYPGSIEFVNIASGDNPDAEVTADPEAAEDAHVTSSHAASDSPDVHFVLPEQ